MQPFGNSQNGPVKLTIISESPREKLTTVYDTVFPLSADARMDPPDLVRGGVREFALPSRPTHADIELRFAVKLGDDGTWGKTTRESRDPIPEEIAKLVDEATQHNVNAQQRARLKRQLVALVENDRKHNNKENNK